MPFINSAVLPQKKDPIEGIYITQILMYLECAKMDYFDTLNQEVILENNSSCRLSLEK